MTATNDLIAQPEGQKPFEGGGLADSIHGLTTDIQDGKNGLTLAVDGAAVGLDALGIALDPLGAVLSAGVGWLLEHISFLREPLEVLTGDPKQIQALAKTWSTIATELDGAAGDYADALGDVAAWGGEASAEYRKAAKDYVDSLRAVAENARDTSQGISVAGVIIATERALVFAVISEFVGKVIAKAILAVAAAWFSFGSSLGWFITSVIGDAITLFARLGKRLAKLMELMSTFAGRFAGRSARARSVSDALTRKSGSIDRWADPKINGSRVADVLFTPPGYDRYKQWADGSFLGQGANVSGSIGARTASEAAKAGRDFGDGIDDGHYQAEKPKDGK